MADVGHEVPPHGLDAMMLGHVPHQSHRSEHLALAFDGTGLHLVVSAGLSVQLDGGRHPLAGPRPLEQVPDHPADQSLAVAGLQERSGRGVVGDHPAAGIAEHEPRTQSVQARLDPPRPGVGRETGILGEVPASSEQLPRSAGPTIAARGRIHRRTAGSEAIGGAKTRSKAIPTAAPPITSRTAMMSVVMDERP